MYEYPKCDSSVFIQVYEQTEVIELNDNGDPVSIEPTGNGEVKSVECGECEAVVE